jgi:phage gp36-like protein
VAYSTTADIQAIYGETNVALWSNLENVSISDGTPTLDSARVASAIAYADSVINDRFRGRRYAVPFSPVPVAVTNWSATIAGVWLYRRRGMATGADTDETNRYAGMEANALREMDLYLAGSRRLDLPESDQRPTAPVVVF